MSKARRTLIICSEWQIFPAVYHPVFCIKPSMLTQLTWCTRLWRRCTWCCQWLGGFGLWTQPWERSGHWWLQSRSSWRCRWSPRWSRKPPSCPVSSAPLRSDHHSGTLTAAQTAAFWCWRRPWCHRHCDKSQQIRLELRWWAQDHHFWLFSVP